MSDDQRDAVAKLKAIRDRMASELADFGRVGAKIIQWVERGDALLARVEELEAAVLRHIDATGDLIERVNRDDGADWWKQGGADDVDG